MTFEEALRVTEENNKRVSSKTYRVCPNPKTDDKGYLKFLGDLKNNNKLTDKDSFYYSNNSDFDVLEGSYY